MIYAEKLLHIFSKPFIGFENSIECSFFSAKTYNGAENMLLKEHPIYTNYLISSNGDIINKNFRKNKNKKLMKVLISSNGYFKIALTKNKKYLYTNVHRLIAETFIDNPLNKPCVNHIDGIKTNNNISNLEWCTYSENMIHAVKTSLLIHYGKEGLKGKYNKRSKKIEQINKITNKVIKVWNSSGDIERKLGICGTNIRKVCRKESKSAYNFKWKYIQKLSKKEK